MKYLYPALLLLFVVGCSRRPTEKIYHKSSLLWKISGNGLKSPSYLFGTYHTLGKEFADSLGIVEKIKMCKAVAGEAIIDSALHTKMLAAMTLPNGTLKDLFTPEEYDSVANVFRLRSRLSLELLDNYKPAAIEATLMVILSPKPMQAGSMSLDKYVQHEGARLGEKVIGLETVEEQLNMVFDMPIARQKARLLFSVREIDAAKRSINKMYSLYLDQDIEGMHDLAKTDKELSAAEWDAMLKDRNLKWMEKIPAILRDLPTFIAVGAMHLGGPYGLIKQLKLKGYTVTPIAI